MSRIELIESLIRNIPDFPEPGIQFKDISTLIGSAVGFRATIEELVERAPGDVEIVAGVDSRGFLFAAPVALELGVGLVPIRKPGKLPFTTISESYDLEYSKDELSIHVDAIQPGQKVLIIDDLIATAGTLTAAAKLIRRCGGELVGVQAVIELTELGGREKLHAAGVEQVDVLVQYTI